MQTQDDEIVALTSELIRIDTSDYGSASGSERSGVRVLDRFRSSVV